MSMWKFKFQKRDEVSPWLQVGAVIFSIILALLISALLVIAVGSSATEAMLAIYEGALGSPYALLESLVQATPIMLTGLAMALAFQGKVWNIGAEGQFFAGAMAASWAAMAFSSLPQATLIPILLIAAALGGGIWGFIPGILKARLGTSEIIVTVMMNYIILYLLSYLLGNVWQEPGDHFLETPRFADSTYLPTFFQSRLHLGFFIALVLAVAVYFLLWKTSLGYEIRAIGNNPKAAQFKGIKMQTIIILVMTISGAIAGIAGGGEVLGTYHRLRMDIPSGYGFTGILIAMLGKLNPLGVIPAAIFFGALINGSNSMYLKTGIPIALVYSIQGIVLICLLTTDVLIHYRLRRVTDVDK